MSTPVGAAIQTVEKLTDLQKWLEKYRIPDYRGFVALPCKVWRQYRELDLCEFSDAELEAGFIEPDGLFKIMRIAGFGSFHVGVDRKVEL